MIHTRVSSIWSKSDCATWILFFLFTLTIVGKCIFFRCITYDTTIDPYASVWLSVLSISLFIASFIFVCRRKYWILYVSAILDAWIIANLWYWRAYHTLLDVFAITMIGNLNDGYWASIQLLFDWKDLLFPLSTLLLGLSFLLLDNRKRSSVWYTLFFCVLSIGLHSIHTRNLRRIPNVWPDVLVNCFSHQQHHLLLPLEYEKRYTIIHSLPKNINAYIFLKSEQHKASTEIMHSEDPILINQFINSSNHVVQANGKLLLVLIESLESWCLNPFVMPHTYQLLNNESTLYVPHIACQVAGGLSSDAQLLMNTGLLPIKSGAVSHLYADNIFPSIADIYDTLTLSIASTPLDDCWHQWAMNKAYHFDVAWSKSSDDSVLFTAVKDAVERFDYVQVFTISTHSPFDACAHQSSLSLPDELPELFANYIHSMHVLDAGLAEVLVGIESDSVLQHATIVITGDHAVFPADKLDAYDKACRESDLPFQVTQGGYVPLIVYSPNIQEKTYIPERCYQMDIYPTILHLIGCKNYFWHGFGVNLLDSTARHNRPITPQQASDLSDKIIRADYFQHIVDSLGVVIAHQEPIFEP